MVSVTISTRCYPTEDRAKVRGAMTVIFPDAVVTGDELLLGKSSSVEHFGELLSRQKIRDAARRVMRRGLRGNSSHFLLNKQVAAVGKVSFSDEAHALGDIDVTIEAQDIEALIDSIAPNTRSEAFR